MVQPSCPAPQAMGVNVFGFDGFDNADAVKRAVPCCPVLARNRTRLPVQ